MRACAQNLKMASFTTDSHHRQPPQSVVNGFLDQGKFGAMKTLNGWKAARCDEHQFCAKIKVST